MRIEFLHWHCWEWERAVFVGSADSKTRRDCLKWIYPYPLEIDRYPLHFWVVRTDSGTCFIFDSLARFLCSDALSLLFPMMSNVNNLWMFWKNINAVQKPYVRTRNNVSLSLLLISLVSLLRALVRTYTTAATELMYRPEFRNLSLNVQVSTAMYLWIYPRLRLDHWIRVLLRSALSKFCKHLPCIYCVVNEYFIFPKNSIRRIKYINLMLYVYMQNLLLSTSEYETENLDDIIYLFVGWMRQVSNEHYNGYFVWYMI